MPKQRHTQPSRGTKKPAAHTQPKPRPVQKPAKRAKSKVAAQPAARRPAVPAKKVGKSHAPKASVAKPAGRPVAAPAGKHRPKLAAPSAVKPAVGVTGPSTHEVAVDVFERGFQALQQRQFGRAAELLGKVVNGYPDEKELQERARVYLSICERQKAGQAPNPKSLEERINAATVALNRGAFAEGLAWLRKAEADHRDNDHLQYMLCVAYTVLGDAPHALEHLKQAVALNHENRYLATQDTDLDPLRQDAAFATALDTPPASKPAKPLARRR